MMRYRNFRKLYRFLAAFIWAGIAFPVSSQVLENSLPFSSATSFLEPDGRMPSCKVSNEEFVVISKVKGNLSGESQYFLEKYDRQLNQKFKTPFLLGQQEEYLRLSANGNVIQLLTVLQQTSESKSILKVYEFDLASGAVGQSRDLITSNIKPWFESSTKGIVKSDFRHEICFTIPSSFVTAFNYKYYVYNSPDNKSILVYQYDYSQKNLVAKTWWFDSNFQLKQQAVLPIDNGFTNHGIYITNKGDYFILNEDKSGKVVVIWYDSDTDQNKLLDIQSTTNSIRNSLKLQVLSEEMVYVAGITISHGKESMKGIMYAKFDFKQMIVDKINIYDLSQNLEQTASIMRGKVKGAATEENWENFEITHLLVNEFEKIILVLEKREIVYTGYDYSSLAVVNSKSMNERLGKVNIESIVMFSFNKDDEMLWENYYMKAQSNDVIAGTTVSSFSLDITDDGRIRMFYPSSDNSTGMYNVINYVEWDELSGMKSKELKTPNEEGLSMLTDYTVWWPDRVVLVGRKGMLGKKSFITLYKLEVN